MVWLGFWYCKVSILGWRYYSCNIHGVYIFQLIRFVEASDFNPTYSWCILLSILCTMSRSSDEMQPHLWICFGKFTTDYPCLWPDQDTKGKEGRTKSNGTAIKTLQAESQRTVSVPKIGQAAIKNKSLIRTYMQRHTMTEITVSKILLRTVSKILLGA